MALQAAPPMPNQWWVHDPELSDAFQVGMVRDDSTRALWWGNQVVGRATRTAEPGCWSATGRDDVALPNPQEPDRGLYEAPEPALLRARDVWRSRPIGFSSLLGEDYWSEPRPEAGVESLWLGRIHLGYIRPAFDFYEAFTTDDDPIAPLAGQRRHLCREDALLAVRGAWRRHLHRILRIQRT